MAYWLNGQFKEDAATINVADRGLLLGDGVFETVLLVDGVPVFWDAHRERLGAALQALHFQVETSVFALSTIMQLAERNGVSSGLGALRLTVTRGAGARGLAPLADAAPTLLMAVHPYASSTDNSLELIVSAYHRNENSLAARFKTLNYLENVMARYDAAKSGADDAIMLNSAGRVACASAANIFLLGADKIIITPPVSEGALPGIVRKVLLERASEAGFSVKEQAIEPSMLQAGQIFLSNSLIGLRAAHLHGCSGAIGGDALPPALQAWYKSVVKADIKQRARLL